MADLQELIGGFFARHGSANLILPDGWIGRPYDDRYILKAVSVEDGRIRLDLHTGDALVVDDDARVHEVGGSLLISRFGLATFGRDPNGPRTYREGVIEFVGVGAERVDQATRDEG